MSNKKISLIIVNYNSTSYLIRLLKSLKKVEDIIKDIIIVDNNSSKFNVADVKKNIPKSIQQTIIINNQNVGFSRAVNHGIFLTKSKYVLLLNPDTLILDSSLEQLVNRICKYDDIGAIGGKIVSFSNEPYYSANKRPNFWTGLFEFTNLKKLFPNNQFTNDFWIEKNNKHINSASEVDSLCGAFILFRKHSNHRLNLFDENFFLYLEDLDFCLTLRNQGMKVVFDPISSVKHIGGGSSDSVYHSSLKHWYASRKYFFCKHLKNPQGIILKIIFSIEEHLLYLYHYILHEPTE